MKHITIPSQRHITLGAVGMVLLAAIVYFACPSSSDIRENILSGNYHAAFQAALRKAENGESDSQNTLGNLYYLGLGTKRSYRAAARWYVKAALQNYGPARQISDTCIIRDWVCLRMSSGHWAGTCLPPRAATRILTTF